MSSVTELLKNIPIFSDLEEETLMELAERCRRMKFNKNSVLMTEGEPGESLYIIETGSAKVFVSDENGDEMVLYIRDSGSYIGDIALLDDAPRSASVVTLEKTTVLSMSKPDFLALLRSNAELPLAIIRTLTRRLRHETDSVRSLALDNVYRRLASKLEELSCVEDGGAVALPRKFSHHELSTMIGASREMVSKIISELVKGEYIETRNNRIYILKKLPHDW